VDPYNEHWERKQTRNLLGKNCLIAVCLPIASCILVWLYFTWSGRELERVDMKRMVLVLWLGTLVVLVWKGLEGVGISGRIRRRWQRKVPPDKRDTYVLKRPQSAKWEQKKTGRIIHELMAMVVLLPLLSYSLVWFCFFLWGSALSGADWKTAALCIWLGTLLCLIRVGYKASKDRLLYSQEGKRK
jgi:hypothetical protein